MDWDSAGGGVLFALLVKCYRECGGVLRGDLLRVSRRVLYSSIVGAKT